MADVLWEDEPVDDTSAFLEHISSSIIGMTFTASGREEDLGKVKREIID